MLLVMCASTPPTWALSPYVTAEKIACQGLPACIARTSQKLQSNGLLVIGVHRPVGMSEYAVLVATDKAFLDTVVKLGGSAIVGAGIRIGVKADGTVSYINPDYWYRAYFQKKFDMAAPQVTALSQRLAKILGRTREFGGDVPATELPNYRYMIGMERFDSDKNELKAYPNFQAAVRTVQENLARRVANTGKVYEIILPDKKLAVFGVALNDPQFGEAWWAGKIGAEHVAALPWEIYVVDGKAYALYARYRTALAWPNLSMANFMAISDHPDTTHEMLTAVAGGKYQRAGW